MDIVFKMTSVLLNLPYASSENYLPESKFVAGMTDKIVTITKVPVGEEEGSLPNIRDLTIIITHDPILNNSTGYERTESILEWGKEWNRSSYQLDLSKYSNITGVLITSPHIQRLQISW